MGLYYEGKRIEAPVQVNITQGGPTDQEYNPESANAQSGKAVAEAVCGTSYVSLPSKILVKTNSEFKVYFRNILSRKDAIFWLGTAWNDNLETRYYDEYFTVSASAEGNFDLPWKVFDQKYNLLASGKLTIVVSAKVPSNETKVIVIGDSTVNDGTMVKKAVELYTDAGATLTSLGTRTSLGQKHEGRSGWTAKMYCTVASSGDISNPFYNNGFNFAYYMTNQGYSGIQAVAIQLGINDIFQIRGGDVNAYDSTEPLNYIDEMVSSILAYDNSIKVIINLPTTPNSNGTSFTETYETTQIYWYYNHNIIRFAKDLREHFASNPSVVVSASNCILDTKTQIRDGVHPTADGYNALGQRLYEVLSSIVDGTEIYLLDISSREYAQHQGDTIPKTSPRELSYGKCYTEGFTGGRTISHGITSYSPISPSAFTITMSTANGNGVNFPVDLEAGKTYALKYTFSHAGRCYVLRYNMDTTFYDYTNLTTTAGAFEKTITVEDGYIYSILFAPFVTETEVTVSDISLTENT